MKSSALIYAISSSPVPEIRYSDVEFYQYKQQRANNQTQKIKQRGERIQKQRCRKQQDQCQNGMYGVEDKYQNIFHDRFEQVEKHIEAYGREK